jgi:glycosyltransferase involved in cell wall biosynthesis
MPQEAAFAIPGDIETRTGGYIYDRRMLESLNAIGLPTRHVALLPSWPHPTPEAEADLARQLAALPEGMPVVMDGLVFGAMDTATLAAQTRPIIVMLHHPLGLEAGLPPALAQHLLQRERDNLRHAAHVVVPSPHTRACLMAEFDAPEARISVALPGFDRPATAPPGPKTTPPLILAVGIICQRKGHDILLDALGRLAHLDWQAAIVGMVQDAGVYRALLEQRAALGLDGRVQFTGGVGPEALDQLYRQATLFALATRYEGYGMVLSEAQLYGLPIVSCAVGAVPQTVTAASAILAPPEDAAAFADGLARLLQDAGLRARMGAASAAQAARLPQWQDAAQIMRRAILGA